MRKIKILIVFFALFVGLKLSSQTNVYHPFPTDTAIWFHNFIPTGCSGGCPYYRTIQMGDTILSTVAYKKVYKQQGTYFPSCGGSNPCFNPSGYLNYVGALRQDSALKKVYFFPTGLTHDTLLYDFNLNLGDTLAKSYLNGGGFGIVKKIDSILVNGEYNKAFSFTPTLSSNESFLIEGVGNSFGPLEYFGNNLNDYHGLCCFNQNQIPNTACSGICPMHVLEINQINESPELIISPNPVNSTFTIKGTKNIGYIKITDVLGNEIKSQRMAAPTNEIMVDVNRFDSGVYYILITSVTETIIKKIIVSR